MTIRNNSLKLTKCRRRKRRSIPDILRAMEVGEVITRRMGAQNAQTFRKARFDLRKRGEGIWEQESRSRNRIITIKRIG